MTGDGVVDIVVVDFDAKVATLRGMDAFSFAAAELSSVAAPAGIDEAMMTDVTGDSQPDLIFASNQGDIQILSGTGTTRWSAQASIPESHGIWQLAVNDIDRDGVPEITAGNYQQAVIFEHTVDHHFVRREVVGFGAASSAHVFGDFNNDGVVDVWVGFAALFNKESTFSLLTQSCVP